MEQIIMNIGAKINDLIIEKSLSHEEVATKSNLYLFQLEDICEGRVDPTISTLSNICDTLNISLSDFFDESIDGDITAKSLVNAFYRLNKDHRQALMSFITAVVNGYEWI